MINSFISNIKAYRFFCHVTLTSVIYVLRVALCKILKALDHGWYKYKKMTHAGDVIMLPPMLPLGIIVSAAIKRTEYPLSFSYFMKHKNKA